MVTSTLFLVVSDLDNIALSWPGGVINVKQPMTLLLLISGSNSLRSTSVLVLSNTTHLTNTGPLISDPFASAR